MDIKAELKSLLGREVEVTHVVVQGKKGYIPVYFNYADRNAASKLFSESEEGALSNLLQHIKEQNPGGTNGTDTTS